MSKKSKASLRQRLRDLNTSESSDHQVYGSRNSKKKKHLPTPTSHLFSALALMLVVFVAVIVIEKRLPPGLKIEEEHLYPDRFIAEHAMNHLKNLTGIGERVAGSRACEVEAANFLKNEIQNIITNAKDPHIIELDVQRTSGAFPLTFLDGMTNVYNNLQNIVVRVGSRINSPHSLLLNCHFDTVADSPGASDDGAGCAVMLEILRVLTKSDRILRHNIIFLFNGGEESFMPASHGFITQHKWAKEIRAFINLEACGAGGREVLFQAGPNNPWILETYSNEVPYPYASSLAQEIFQSGIIPGDTDYRIFRDFGKVSGLDFAWSANGYVYHTELDTVDHIPIGSIQRTGDNILALARGIASGHQLSDIEQYQPGNLVFFDFLGAFVVRWPEFFAHFINVCNVLVSLYSIYSNSIEANKHITKKSYFKYISWAMLGIVLSWCITIVTVLLIAGALNVLDRTMSWFARPLWVFFLYVCPTMLVNMTVILYHSKAVQKHINMPWIVFQIYYDGYQMIWTSVLFLSVLLRIRSGFIPLMWVVFPTVGNLIRQRVFSHWRDWKWLLMHITAIGLPFIQSFYLLLGALYLFIPIMGRIGAGNNSEIIVAVLVGSFFSLLNSYVTPLIILVKSPQRILSCQLGVFLISVGVLLLTPLGFPYSGDADSLAPQRFMMSHVERKFYNESNQLISRSTGYWLVDFDINSPHSVDRLVPEMRGAELMVEDCTKYLYCGQPYLVPVMTFMWISHFIPGPEPYIPQPVNFEVVGKRSYEDRSGSWVQVVLNITGPDHMGVMISPVQHAVLARWSLVNDTPLAATKWNGRDTYFIYYTYALDTVPLVFSMDFQVPKNHKGPVMDIAVTSHFMHGPHKRGEKFKQFIAQFPKWTTITAWASTYTSWIV